MFLFLLDRDRVKDGQCAMISVISCSKVRTTSVNASAKRNERGSIDNLPTLRYATGCLPTPCSPRGRARHAPAIVYGSRSKERARAHTHMRTTGLAIFALEQASKANIADRVTQSITPFVFARYLKKGNLPTDRPKDAKAPRQRQGRTIACPQHHASICIRRASSRPSSCQPLAISRATTPAVLLNSNPQSSLPNRPRGRTDVQQQHFQPAAKKTRQETDGRPRKQRSRWCSFSTPATYWYEVRTPSTPPRALVLPALARLGRLLRRFHHLRALADL